MFLSHKKSTMEEFSAGGVVANVAGGITLSGILTYFGLTGEALIIFTASLMLDWIFGVVNAYIQGELKSKLMARGLIRKASRLCIPMIVVAILRGAGFQEIEMIATSIVTILTVAEGYSIIGHIYSINYGKTLPEIDALKALLEWIAKLFKNELDSKTGDKKSE